MRIAIVTDAWAPQVNGVVRTLQAIRDELEVAGHQVLIVSPDIYPSLPCPTYPEIRLALAGSGSVGHRIARFGADAIHLATEGPLCLAARRWCLREDRPFTTAYHTQFPDYVARRTGIPTGLVWRYIRWFHGASHAVLVSTPSVRRTLAAHGVAHVRHWGRGVDLSLFSPDVAGDDPFAGLARPIQLYVGRIAIEKNLEAFLKTDRAGTRVIVGAGPARAALQTEYPNAVFVGALTGDALARAYASADVFVFPSRTDTFGLVMIEALASGTPVAAYPVSGPIDILTPDTGAMREDLGEAIDAALTLDRSACAALGSAFTWEASARQFVEALVPARARAAA